MSSHNLVAGSAVVVREDISPYELREILRFEAERIYHVEKVQIFPKRTVLSREYIEHGYIPDVVRKYCSMPKGIWTTNHDLIDGDRFVQINGRELSCAWFRPATATEGIL
jgi:hypothetical protein